MTRAKQHSTGYEDRAVREQRAEMLHPGVAVLSEFALAISEPADDWLGSEAVDEWCERSRRGELE